MVGQFSEEDVAEVVFVGEFGEEGPCGAAACELGVDGVGEVGSDADAVDDDEECFTHGVPPGALFAAQGKEHEDDVEGVGVEDGGAVEAQASSKEVADGEGAPACRVEAPVFADEGYAAEHVDEVGKCEVGYYGEEVAGGCGFDFHDGRG